VPSKTPRAQAPILDEAGRRLRRQSIYSAMHPEARKAFNALAKQHNVSRSWLAAFAIETFLYGEGNTYAENPEE